MTGPTDGMTGREFVRYVTDNRHWIRRDPLLRWSLTTLRDAILDAAAEGSIDLGLPLIFWEDEDGRVVFHNEVAA